jgi:hypothetical protein
LRKWCPILRAKRAVTADSHPSVEAGRFDPTDEESSSAPAYGIPQMMRESEDYGG